MGLLEDQEKMRQQRLEELSASLQPAFEVPAGFAIHEVDPKEGAPDDE